MEKLPLLTFTSSLFPKINLENTLVIGCQHILETTFTMLEELFEQGLKPENLYLLGKCYSTNQEIFERFQKAGVNISPFSNSFDSHRSFDDQFQIYVEKFVASVKNISNYKKVIVLDDGGYLISHINALYKNTWNIVGIEQTSSGHTKLLATTLKFPVINVARSKVKLEVESPMIAELVVENIKQHLKNLENKDPNILVVGQGHIGSSVSTLLKKDFKVNGCDMTTHKCDFSGDFKKHLNNFDVIVGASGQPIINTEDINSCKKDVTFISVSSSDREFPALYFRTLLPKYTDCHRDININEIKIINSGFPINFDGEKNSLAPEKIQLTRALLLAAVFQAQTEKISGLIDLDGDIQEKIIREFKKIYP